MSRQQTVALPLKRPRCVMFHFRGDGMMRTGPHGRACERELDGASGDPSSPPTAMAEPCTALTSTSLRVMPSGEQAPGPRLGLLQRRVLEAASS